jgi:acyl transferase domain-containing protein/NAD(P)-dependent dehydrogenase (short-subunit alcohol dehydrogenase family)/acyl carrier protein
VAIIGIGCLFPKAQNLGQYWTNILNGVDAITEVPPTHWQPDDYFDENPKAPDRTYACRGGFLSPVDFPLLDFGISPNSLEAIDTTQLLGLMVAREALKDAGYGPDRQFDRNRISVILGVTGTLELVIPLGARLGHPIWRRALEAAGVEESVAKEVIQRISDSYVGWQEDSFPGLLGNVVAGRIANRLDLKGTNCVVDAACASSLSALHLATLELASCRCDMVLTGGLDTFNDIFMYMCFSKTPALSPTGDARPFDRKADGTILGEGLGILVLKRLEDAERDADKIYAVIKGIGSSSDGKGQAIYAPKAEGQANALRQAYRLADITPETIELVEAHGTGTAAGDAAELTALTEVFQKSPLVVPASAGEDHLKAELRTSLDLQSSNLPPSPWCALGSVKSQIGHTKAAAGVAGLIKAALALHHKALPPTIKIDHPVESLTDGQSPFYINTKKRPWLSHLRHPRRAAVSSFGFGGSNFHCVLEEYHREKENIDWDGNVQIVTFSANTREELLQQISETSEICRSNLGRRRVAFQSAHAYRLALVLERDKSDLSRLLSNARSMLEKHAEKKTWSNPEGIYFGAGPVTGKLALLFPGQGSQYVGMFRDLACQFPQMQETLTEAEAAWEENSRIKDRGGLSDFIYPPSSFGEEDRRRQEESLRATNIAQPAIGAVSLGAFRILEHFGIRPDAVGGHSFGELVALCVAGRIDSRTLHSLSIHRGRLMAAPSDRDGKTNGDPGAMLAVRGSLQMVQRLLAEEKLDLIVANKNAPNQLVLSGSRAEIGRATSSCSRRGIESQILPVSAAFHSSFVAEVRQPFLAKLEESNFAPGSIPVFSNTTGDPYPDNPQEARQLLAGQLAQPVEFIAEIEAMYRSGIRTFVEVGPANKLSALVGAILGDREHHRLAVDASSGRHSGASDLARMLAHVAVLGYPVFLSRWNEGIVEALENKNSGLLIPICGSNYRKKKSEVPGDRTPRRFGSGEAQEISEASKTSAIWPSTRGNGATTRNGDDRMGEIRSETRTEMPKFENREEMFRSSIASSSGAEANSELTAILRNTQENLLALQKLGEQTAQMHRLFLEGQDRALQAFQSLLQHQQQFVGAFLGNATPVRADDGRQLDSSGSCSPVRDSKSPRIDLSRPNIDPQGAGPASLDSDAQPAKNILLEVVSEKTGYPAAMLELDMEMDTDLGIDSIKRVEIFSALQERLPQAPQVKSEHLAALRTLRQICDFLSAGSDRQVETPSPPEAEANCAEGQKLFDDPSFERILLEVVAEKTGYPAEMLEPDMELDDDLGIDSIKRVEIFSALQEKLPQAPAVKSEHLGTLRTLRQVLDFLSGSASSETETEKQRDGETATLPVMVAASPCGPFAGLQTPTRTFPHLGEDGREGGIRRFVLKTQPLERAGERRRIEIAEGGEIWITKDDSSLPEILSRLLKAEGYRPQLLDLSAPPAPSKDLLAGLIILTPAGKIDDAFLRCAFQMLQTAGPGLRRGGNAGGSVFATVSRVDGSFGLGNHTLGENGILCGHPIAGGLAGLAKTAAKEWPEVHCKALDIPASWNDPDAAASAIAREIFVAGPMEVGISSSGIIAPQLDETNLPLTTHHSPLTKEDVVILTGGARGITAEVAVALARAFSPTLILLGRSPEPRPEPEWLVGLTEERQIKQALLAHSNAKNSPKEIEQQFRHATAQREICRTLQRIGEIGTKVLYRNIDVRNADAVREVCAKIRDRFGLIRGLIHGAGVLADRRIEDKTLEQFERVYNTKVQGLRNLLESINSDDLRLLVLFSSSTARFGRAGQVDYAVANEVLNKLAQQEARRRPACRVVSLNWGPWEGGMVTPSLRKLFESEGVGLIPLKAGADYFMQEICQDSDRPVEVVVLGPNTSVERLSFGNGRIETQHPVSRHDSPPPTYQAPLPAHYSPLAPAFEMALDVEHFPFLRSHVIDGHAVLPVAMTLEWLAHGAIHQNPGLVFHGCDELRVLKGVILKGDEPHPLSVFVGKAVKEKHYYRVPVELRSDSTETGAELMPARKVLHARADMILVERLPEASQEVPEIVIHSCSRTREEIYDGLLFHGPDMQGIKGIEGCSERGIVGQVSVAPAPATWIHRPLRSAWLGDPLAIDSALQMMVLWGFENYGSPSLPCFIGRYRQYRRSFPREGSRVIAAVKEAKPQRATADIVLLDAAGQVVARLDNYECVIDPKLNGAFRRKQLREKALTT